VTPNRNVVFKAYGFKPSETIRVNRRYGTGKPGLVRVMRAGKGGAIAINLKFKYTGKVTVSARNASGRTVSAVVRVVKKGYSPPRTQRRPVSASGTCKIINNNHSVFYVTVRFSDGSTERITLHSDGPWLGEIVYNGVSLPVDIGC
jgi:hypothetical protein